MKVTIPIGGMYEVNGSGNYTVVNHSFTSPIEVVGGVNSTMLFNLGSFSYASFDEYNGIKLFNKSDEPVTVTITCEDTENNLVMMNGLSFCIDAGHGGNDPGAVNGSHSEKNTALKIALKLASMLENAGADVIMTRSDDTFIQLSERAAIANRNNCTAFVSIHLNSAENKSATGYEVLVYNSKSSSKANELANLICMEMFEAVSWPNRGVKDRPELTVLKKTTMPAVLVEVGFISNDKESSELLTDTCQQSIATAIYNGIKNTYAVKG